MATYSSSTVMQTNTTGTMRPQVQFVESLLSAAGWVQTADTGQTAGSAFPAATSTLTVAGYQIWRMADTLQATKPVYVKFEFGSGNAANSFGMWITIGTGSNGTGTITGILNGGVRAVCPAQTTTSATRTHYGSGSTNRLCFIMGTDTVSANTNLLISIERSKDGTGADTGDGVIFQYVAGASTQAGQHLHYYMPFTGNYRAPLAYPCSACPPSLAFGSLADGVNYGVIPFLPFGQGGPLNHGTNLMAYYSTDIAALSNISITVHALTITYKTLGALFGVTAINAWTGSCWAIRYE